MSDLSNSGDEIRIGLKYLSGESLTKSEKEVIDLMSKNDTYNKIKILNSFGFTPLTNMAAYAINGDLKTKIPWKRIVFISPQELENLCLEKKRLHKLIQNIAD